MTMLFKKIEINSLDSMVMGISGMRGKEEFEALPTETGVELSYYVYYFSSIDDQRVLQGRAIVDTDKFIELLKECNVPKWDGFSGKHPKNVRDGYMFDFKACVNGGDKIHASGSENFPKGYHDLVRSLRNLIRENTTSEDDSK